jgi:hypothetical protein
VVVRLTVPEGKSEGRKYESRHMLQPKHLDSIAALMTAQKEPLRKLKGERDTDFVKRIVATYLNYDEAVKGAFGYAERAKSRSARR